jgi:aminopeptidase N
MTPKILIKSCLPLFIAAISLLACTNKTALHNLSQTTHSSLESASGPGLAQTDTVPPAWASLYRASRPLDFRLIHTRLELRPLFETSQLDGKAWIRMQVGFYPIQRLDLDAQGFTIRKLAMRTLDADSGRWIELPYRYNRKVVSAQLPGVLAGGTPLEIQMHYLASPDSLNAGPGSAAIQEEKGLYFIRPDSVYPDKPLQVWTQGETDHNSCWFPTIDAPNQKMTQEISIRVDSGLVTLSNGIMTQSVRHQEDGTRTDTWSQPLPHAPYLAMIAAGKFSVIKDRWRNIPVHYYVEPQYAPIAARIFHRTPDMLDYYSRILGVDYPWSSYHQIAVRDFVSGAMENTGAVVFGQWAQRSSRELTDGSAEGTVAHEMFHHWFGDLVTCESWSNLSLNESFATYGTPLWYEHAYGKEEADAALEGNLRDYLAESRRKQVDLIRYYYEENEDMFDRHSYAKGARVLHMLRNEIGEKAFFESLQLYLARHRFKAAEIHDFRLVCEEVTGRDLQVFFDQWFLSKGHPVISMKYRYDSDSQQCVFIISQKHSAIPGKLFSLPIQLEFYFYDSSTARRIVLDKADQEFRFDLPRPVWTGHDLGRIVLCEYDDQRTFEEFIMQFKGGLFYYDRKRALEQLVRNPRFWGAWSDPSQVTSATEYQDIIARALRDPSPVIRSLAAESVPVSILKQDFLLYKLLSRTVESDARSSVRQRALLKLIETADSGKALETNWLDKILDKDSSLLVASAGLKGLVKISPPKALAAARQLEAEPTMAGPLMDFYSKYGEIQDLVFIEKSLLQLRDSRSQRQFAGWLKAYNTTVLRMNQRERGLALYEKLLVHPSGRIRNIAAEQRLELDSK